ncbi:alpha/beta hydrolase [Kribbella ginsengisoli]
MTVSHWVVGEGPVVVLVHAGVGDARMWAQLVEDLRVDHRVITLDLRGYGETPLAIGTKYSDAGDVLDLLDELAIETAAMVAASYGGYVALQAATRRPERFSRLVLMAPPVDGVDRTDDQRAFGAAEDDLLEAGDVDGATALNVHTWLGPDADDKAQELVFAMQRRAFELQLAAGDDIENEEYEVDLAAVSTPVKLFTGAHDLQYFHDCGAHLAANLPKVDYTELAWAGHLPSLERPAEMNALIRAALS